MLWSLLVISVFRDIFYSTISFFPSLLLKSWLQENGIIITIVSKVGAFSIILRQYFSAVAIKEYGSLLAHTKELQRMGSSMVSHQAPTTAHVMTVTSIPILAAYTSPPVQTAVASLGHVHFPCHCASPLFPHWASLTIMLYTGTTGSTEHCLRTYSIF